MSQPFAHAASGAGDIQINNIDIKEKCFPFSSQPGNGSFPLVKNYDVVVPWLAARHVFPRHLSRRQIHILNFIYIALITRWFMLFDDLAVLVEVIRMRKHNEAWLSDDERTSAQEFSNARRQLASTQDIWKEQVGLPEFSHTPASAVLTSLWSYNDTPTSTASGELERSIAGTLNIADNTVFRKNIYIFFKFLTFKKRKKNIPRWWCWRRIFLIVLSRNDRFQYVTMPQVSKRCLSYNKK